MLDSPCLPAEWRLNYGRNKKTYDYVARNSGAARGGRGKLPPYGWTSKNCVICVCFHCHGTSSYHTTNTLQGCRAKSATLIHRQYNRDWGTSYSRPPIDPYLTSPLLQNPGGATASEKRSGHTRYVLQHIGYIFSHSSINTANLAKIRPVDVEIIGPTEIVKYIL